MAARLALLIVTLIRACEVTEVVFKLAVAPRDHAENAGRTRTFSG